MDIQAEERAQTERIELERLQLRGGMGVPVEYHARQPGTFFVGLGKPAPNVDSAKTESARTVFFRHLRSKSQNGKLTEAL